MPLALGPGFLIVRNTIKSRYIAAKYNVLVVEHVDGLAKDCSNSSALAIELLQSCVWPSMCKHQVVHWKSRLVMVPAPVASQTFVMSTYCPTVPPVMKKLASRWLLVYLCTRQFIWSNVWWSNQPKDIDTSRSCLWSYDQSFHQREKALHMHNLFLLVETILTWFEITVIRIRVLIWDQSSDSCLLFRS